MASVGDVWQCPIDFLDQELEYRTTDEKALMDRSYRLDHPNTPYKVRKRGKFRPVVILGHQDDPDRYVVAPLYSLHDGAKVEDILKRQLLAQTEAEKHSDGTHYIFTCVFVQPVDVHTASKKANALGLADPSVARLDEVTSLDRRSLDHQLGVLDSKVLRKVVAGYLKVAWQAGVPEVLRHEFGYTG